MWSIFLNKSADGWWMVQMVVLPLSANRFRSDRHWEAADESRPVVGSSKKMTRGLSTSSSAIDRRFCWPPLNFPVKVSSVSFSPSSSRISLICGKCESHVTEGWNDESLYALTRCSFSSASSSFPILRLTENRIASCTVRSGWRRLSCIT